MKTWLLKLKWKTTGLRNKLIKCLGGLTLDECAYKLNKHRRSTALYYKLVMDTNYGKNWMPILYNMVKDEIEFMNILLNKYDNRGEISKASGQTS